MPDPAKLLELAARCEGYAPTGYHDLDVDSRRSLNEEIAAAIGMKLTVKVGDPILGNERMVPSRLPDFIGSLDAAMSLVPDKARVKIDNIDEPWARVHDLSAKGWPSQESYGAHSLAVALCAASLRALAAEVSQ